MTGQEKDEKGITLNRNGNTQRLPARALLWATGVKASPLGQNLAEKTGAMVDPQIHAYETC